MTKKPTIPDGFQDLIDTDFNDRAKAKRRELEKEKNSNFELFSYLEQENDRLDKNSQIYLEKLDVLKRYPQSKIISENASQAINKKMSTVQEKYWKDDSDFIKSLNEIYNRFFNS